MRPQELACYNTSSFVALSYCYLRHTFYSSFFCVCVCLLLHTCIWEVMNSVLLPSIQYGDSERFKFSQKLLSRTLRPSDTLFLQLLKSTDSLDTESNLKGRELFSDSQQSDTIWNGESPNKETVLFGKTGTNNWQSIFQLALHGDTSGILFLVKCSHSLITEGLPRYAPFLKPVKMIIFSNITTTQAEQGHCFLSENCNKQGEKIIHP